MKKISGFCVVLFFMQSLFAQPTMEKLSRGVVAVKVPQGVFISWRLFGYDRNGVRFNILRDGKKINQEAVTGATNYLDSLGSLGSKYQIETVYNDRGHILSPKVSVWKEAYKDIGLRSLNGNYEPNDASVGDLDGDGEYEIVIKRIPAILDTSYLCKVFPVIEAYRLDGSFLWSVNMGPNHLNFTEIDFVVYDLDGDGKSEIALRTCEGFTDGAGQMTADTDGDGIINYRKFKTYHPYVYKGPEFISVLDGRTGKLITREKYIERDPVYQWGGGNDFNKAIHRAKKFMLTPAYLDGKNASLVICRGTYHKIVLEAWSYKNKQLIRQWRFNSEEWPGYESSGNHNLSVADVDHDGRDEIVYGSCVVDDNGAGLYSTGEGHGDALHVADMDPDRPGLEIWQCHESPEFAGATLRDAKTGEVLYQYKSPRDQGRCCAANVLESNRGFELWGSTGCPLTDIHGKKLGMSPQFINFLVYWDGDLERELLDHYWKSDPGIGLIAKFPGTSPLDLLLYANGTFSNNYTKGNPCLSADLFGDWREEVIWRRADNQAIRIFTTVIPTSYKIYTLMHDPQYRTAIAWQQNSYNQPPHLSFYLGDEFRYAPLSPAHSSMKIWNGKSSNVWDKQFLNWNKDGLITTYSDGDSLFFEDLGNFLITTDQDLKPGNMTVFSGNNYTFSGKGSLSGSMGLYKSGKGSLILNLKNLYTGPTQVWDGALIVNNELEHSQVTVYGGTFGGVNSIEEGGGRVCGNGTLKAGLVVESKGCVSPGDGINDVGCLTVEKSLIFHDYANACFDLKSAGDSLQNDRINIHGDLVLSDSASFLIRPGLQNRKNGEVVLISYSGECTGDINKIRIVGLPDGKLLLRNKEIILQYVLH